MKKQNKALYERIMSGVTKAMNEGKFSEWKETNIPKFDLAGYEKSFNNFIENIISPLLAEEQITNVVASYLSNEKLLKICEASAPEKLKTLAKDIYDKLSSLENSVEALNSVVIFMPVNKAKYLYKYVDANMNVNRDRLSDCEEIHIKTNAEGYVALCIKILDIMNDETCQKITDCLS